MHKTEAPRAYYTAKEMAHVLRVTTQCVYNWRDNRAFKAFRRGRVFRVGCPEAHAFVAKHEDISIEEAARRFEEALS